MELKDKSFIVHRDQNNLLHNIEGPAVVFPEGFFYAEQPMWEEYYIHGIWCGGRKNWEAVISAYKAINHPLSK